jgi:acyl carrier protein
MRLASAESQKSYRAAGLEPMPAAEALDALGRLLAGGEPQAVVARIDWSVLVPLHEARRRRPFLEKLRVAPASARREERAAAIPGFGERLAGAAAGMRRELLIELVRHEVAAVLGMGDEVPLETGLFELGMDSLMSVELKRRLEQGAGRPLPSTLTFNYPNVAALAAFLDAELPGTPAPAAAAAPPPAPAPLPPPSPGGDDLDQLTEDELEARLMARLERVR